MTEINIEHTVTGHETDELFITTNLGAFVTSIKTGLSMMYMINIVTCLLEETGVDYSNAVVVFDGVKIDAMETV